MTTPKSERLHIGIFGRTNVGKSSILNFITKQDAALISEIAGTTTDVVEKTIEIAPLGPVVIFDTPGIDDNSELGNKRTERAYKIFSRCDFALLIIEPHIWSDFEENIIKEFNSYNIPFFIIVNKIDTGLLLPEISKNILKKHIEKIEISTLDIVNRIAYLDKIYSLISKKNNTLSNHSLLSDILTNNDICIIVTPIDSGAPKGRLILPQVQTLRELLDLHTITIVTQLEEYVQALNLLNQKPKLIICDSQVVKQIVEMTPEGIYCTTFSILFARMKGNLKEDIDGAKIIKNINHNDKILIAEACSHHTQKDDIATKKIPNLLQQYLGFLPQIVYSHGYDYPANLNEYKLIIHCGACMLSKNEKLNRMKKAQEAGVPITNYGVAMSFMNGYLDKTTKIFDL